MALNLMALEQMPADIRHWQEEHTLLHSIRELRGASGLTVCVAPRLSQEDIRDVTRRFMEFAGDIDVPLPKSAMARCAPAAESTSRANSRSKRQRGMTLRFLTLTGKSLMLGPFAQMGWSERRCMNSKRGRACRLTKSCCCMVAGSWTGFSR